MYSKRLYVFFSWLLVCSMILGLGKVSVEAKSKKIGKVTNVEIQKKSVSTVKLSWKKVSGAQGYEIYLKKGNGSFKKIAKIKETSYLAKNLLRNAKYQFKIRAYKKVKGKTSYGKYSVVKKINMSIPLKTTIQSVKECEEAKVVIKWKPTTDASKYEICRKSPGGKFKTIGIVGINESPEFVDEATEDGKTYYYVVKTCYKTYKTTSEETKLDISKAPEIKEFNVSSLGIFENKATDVDFVVEVSNPNRVKKDEIVLMNGSECVGALQKDESSVNGNLFRLKLSIVGKAGDELKYSVKLRDKATEESSIRVFDQLTAEDFAELDRLDEQINVVNSEYEADGYIPEEKRADVIEAVYSLAEEQKELGNVITVSKSKDGVMIRYASGLWYYYQPQVEGVDAGGKDVSMSVWTMQPYASNAGKDTRETKDVDDSAEYISNQLDNCSFDYNYDNEEVSTEAIKRWSDNQVILWHGHGGFDRNELGTLLYLGEKRTVYSNNTADYSKEEFINGMRVSGSDGRVYISSLYIDNCVGSMKNSFVFLGCCHGAQSDSEIGDKFVNALVNKGATVCAFSDTVMTYYDWAMLQSVSKKMTQIDNTTQYYYTVEKAVEESKQEVGMNNLNYHYKGYTYSSDLGTFLRLFGNKDYRISNECFGTLEIDKTSMNLKVGKKGKISITTNMQKCFYNVVEGRKNVKISTEAGGIIVEGIKAGNAKIVISAGDKSVECQIVIKSKKKPNNWKTFEDGEYVSFRYGNKNGTENGRPSFYAAEIKDGKLVVKGGIATLVDDSDIVNIRPYDSYVFDIDEYALIGYYNFGKFWIQSEEYFNLHYAEGTHSYGQALWIDIEDGKVVRITMGLE